MPIIVELNEETIRLAKMIADMPLDNRTPEQFAEDMAPAFANISDNIEDLAPEYNKLITDNYWELI